MKSVNFSTKSNEIDYNAEVSKAEEAVEKAKKYKGLTLNVTWNKGLMAQELLLYSAPLWEKLTGIKVNLIQLMIHETYPAIEAERKNNSSFYDVISITPSRLPDYTEIKALEPLDSYIDRHGFRSELDDIAPQYRDNWMTWEDKIYTIPDDGDIIFLYYRKDLFEDSENKLLFKSQYGYDLAPPKTWIEFDQMAEFFTNNFSPDLYGCAMIHDSLSFYFFEERFRENGGRFFDEETMNASINSEIGIKTLTQMVNRVKYMPPDAGRWGFMDVLQAFISGKIAMTEFWPPLGRWSEGYGTDGEQLSWVPKSEVAGKVGYAVTPGGYSALAAGFGLSISADSRNKEAAYLFIQWLSSKEVSLKRVQIPYSLRDPYRTSHYNSQEYKNLWANAGDYLELMKTAGKSSLLDLSLYQVNRYEIILTEALNHAFTEEISAKVALDNAARLWNGLTNYIGVEKQRKAYKEWAQRPNAYPR
ncbi:MAG: sugar ABC transporter substrate-binding protein [Desulfobulbaceae bacterium]|nr:sugar ABC transporter substrate-binding protein [Desulfobulbaceae bacterium]